MKGDTQEMRDVTLEGGGDLRAKFLFELLFNEVGGAEVDEIVYVEAYIEGWMTFDGSAVEDTG